MTSSRCPSIFKIVKSAACVRTNFGFDRIGPGQHRPRHLHVEAYATVVLAGAFVQTGYGGRYLVQAGDIAVQPTLDRHADQMISAGIDIIRLPWRFDVGAGGVWRGCDIEDIAKISNLNVLEAAELTERTLADHLRVPAIVEHRADRFFADLLDDPRLEVQAWAAENALTREGLSRSVQRLYGASPTELRCDLRARTAWRLCIDTDEPLALVALRCGYADQAHMTRDLQRFSGGPPAAWRRRQRDASGASSFV